MPANMVQVNVREANGTRDKGTRTYIREMRISLFFFHQKRRVNMKSQKRVQGSVKIRQYHYALLLLGYSFRYPIV